MNLSKIEILNFPLCSLFCIGVFECSLSWERAGVRVFLFLLLKNFLNISYFATIIFSVFSYGFSVVSFTKLLFAADKAVAMQTELNPNKDYF